MIDVAFVYFRTTTLAHLDAAWFTLAKQDFTEVQAVIFLDNNTDDDPLAIQDVLWRYPLPVPLILCFQKHGNPLRTHSWSVNTALRLTRGPFVFFTRSDYLLNYDCLRQLRERASVNRFVTSYCHQMGYDAQLSNTDALAPHSEPGALWRLDPEGPASLVGHVPAAYFQSTGLDAGVWLTSKAVWAASTGLNELLSSWGYQQSEWQRRLVSNGVDIEVIPAYLFAHQHHASPRDFAQAARELGQL